MSTNNVTRRVVPALIALMVGIIPAFFGVGPTVFADGPWSERRITILIVLLVYGVLGLLGGRLFSAWAWGVWLSIPAIAIVLLLFFAESPLLAMLYLALIVAVASAGSALGAARGRAKVRSINTTRR